MAYEVVMPYHLHMPSYFLETFTEYPLLNLGDFRVDTVLPNDIGRCVNHGAETYNVHANYRLDDESPIKIEVLYNYTKLLSRIELSYKSLK